MKAILLGAGYATRLYPLTKNRAKPLLEIPGKTVTDHIVEKIDKVPEIDEVIIVTNDKFAHQFEEWVRSTEYNMKFTVVNDETLTNETRLGAIGDIQFVVDQSNISDDLLTLAGDNLFEFELLEFVTFAKNNDTDALAMYYEDDLNQLKRNGTAKFVDKKIVTDFIEKPENPTYKFCVLTFYVLKSSTLPLIRQYLDEGNNSDALGNFIPYLIGNNEAITFVFEGKRYDIGTVESYNKVQEIYEEKYV